MRLDETIAFEMPGTIENRHVGIFSGGGKYYELRWADGDAHPFAACEVAAELAAECIEARLRDDDYAKAECRDPEAFRELTGKGFAERMHEHFWSSENAFARRDELMAELSWAGRAPKEGEKLVASFLLPQESVAYVLMSKGDPSTSGGRGEPGSCALAKLRQSGAAGITMGMRETREWLEKYKIPQYRIFDKEAYDGIIEFERWRKPVEASRIALSEGGAEIAED